MTGRTYAWARQYPCVIVNDRYGGAYSGGRWVAFPLDAEPEGPSDSNIACADFWDAYDRAPTYPIGLGRTPDEALADLEAKASGRREWGAGTQWWSGDDDGLADRIVERIKAEGGAR